MAADILRERGVTSLALVALRQAVATSSPSARRPCRRLHARRPFDELGKSIERRWRVALAHAGLQEPNRIVEGAVGQAGRRPEQEWPAVPQHQLGKRELSVGLIARDRLHRLEILGIERPAGELATVLAECLGQLVAERAHHHADGCPEDVAVDPHGKCPRLALLSDRQ